MSHLVGLGHLADDLSSGGVNGREGLPTDGVLKFIVDEQLPEKQRKKLFNSSSFQTFPSRFQMPLNVTELPQIQESLMTELSPILNNQS